MSVTGVFCLSVNCWMLGSSTVHKWILNNVWVCGEKHSLSHLYLYHPEDCPTSQYTQDYPATKYTQHHFIPQYTKEYPISQYTQDYPIPQYTQHHFIPQYAQDHLILRKLTSLLGLGLKGSDALLAIVAFISYCADVSPAQCLHHVHHGLCLKVVRR